MSDRILTKFLQPISESYKPKIDFLSEDDLNFLQYLGNYVYEKRHNPKEALNNLQWGIRTAQRRSELFNELRKASKDRLSSHQSIFAEVDISSFIEEDIGINLLEQPCSYMGNIMRGNVDGNLLEKTQCVGEYPFESDNTLLYFPTVLEWINRYFTETNHSLAITEFLRSVQEALQLNEEYGEVICKHEPEVLGKIFHVNRIL